MLRAARRSFSLASCVLGAGLCASACTARTAVIDVPDAGPLLDAGEAADAAAADAGRDAGPSIDGGPRLDDVLVYAHSPDTLFTFSPYTNTVAPIGRFTEPSGANAPDMVDLAVDSDGLVFTTSARALYRVDPLTAVATKVGDFAAVSDQFFGLTFLVAGELGPDEVLVGATNAGEYFRINTNNARTTRLGQYPDEWTSSGDLVSVAGLGTFATLRRADYPDSDVVARITFRADGTSAVTVLGPAGFRQLFGLGYWGRDLYGFSNSGELVRIDRTTGAGTLATAMTGTDRFWGAGVTTQAPVLF